MDATSLMALQTGIIADGRYRQTVTDLGVLHVRSGRLEASDPFVFLGEGFVVAIPPGSYPVKVSVADVSDALDGSHLRESYLSVVLAEGTPARVEFFTPEGREPVEDDFYGVPVDAGTVGFVDADAAKRGMPERVDWYSEIFDNGRDDSWFALMDSAEHYAKGCANVVLPRCTDENVVLSHSGWGDGYYPVLGSYDEAGKLLGVHIDLMVVSEDAYDLDGDGQSEEPEVEEPRPGFWTRLFGGGR